MSIIYHPRGLKELLWKAGRSTETTTFRRLIKKYPGSSGTKAYTIAQQKGLRKIQSLSTRLKVEGLGASQGIKKRFKKFKPSKARPKHWRGKDYPDLADDQTIGGVKAYADLPAIKGRASAEAKTLQHGWGFRPKNPRYYKVTEKRIDPKTKRVTAFRVRKSPQYVKHKNVSAWFKSGRKTYKD